MIEKLSEYKITSRDGSFINVECNTKIINTLVRKINEIIDAVNELQKQIDKVSCAILDLATPDGENKALKSIQVAPADPYAEQHKWIGCLVEYGNADDGFRYGILTNIEPRYSAYPFEIDNGRDATADCWLPSKTIFYKGGDNE